MTRFTTECCFNLRLPRKFSVYYEPQVIDLVYIWNGNTIHSIAKQIMWYSIEMVSVSTHSKTGIGCTEFNSGISSPLVCRIRYDCKRKRDNLLSLFSSGETFPAIFLICWGSISSYGTTMARHFSPGWLTHQTWSVKDVLIYFFNFNESCDEIKKNSGREKYRHGTRAKTDLSTTRECGTNSSVLVP